jgi:hypothetical protein
VATDGPGADLTVFENVMDLGGGDYFRECAFVEVSQDGESWTRFPWNPQSLEGLAGVWPTTGEDPTDPNVSGGDQFDLADLGLAWITHVRLVDCGSEVDDNGLFDLDAVVAVHWETGVEGPADPPANALSVASPFGSSLAVEACRAGRLAIHSIDGRLVMERVVAAGTASIPTAQLERGCYLVVLRSPEGRHLADARAVRL